MADQFSSKDDGAQRRAEVVRQALAHGIVPLRLHPLSKRPVEVGWQQAAVPTDAQAGGWASAGNIGFRTGRVSGGIIVLDLDPGADVEFIKTLPETVTVLTGRTDSATGLRGQHRYYRCTEDLGNQSGGLPAKVDVRGTGGFVVAPGSIHPETGEMYSWAPGLALGEVPIADLPPSVLASIKAAKSSPAVVSNPEAGSWMSKVPKSLRHSAAKLAVADAAPAVQGSGGDKATFKMACDLTLRCGLEREDALSFMQEYNQRSCSPPWDVTALEHKVDEALKLLCHAAPETIGSLLVDFAAEVVRSLGVIVSAEGNHVVLCRDDQRQNVLLCSQLKQLERRYEVALRILTPELPTVVVKAAAAMFVADPPMTPDTVQLMNPFDRSEMALRELPPDVLAEAATLLKQPDLLHRLVQMGATLGYDTRGREHAVEAVILGLMMRLAGRSSYVSIRGAYGVGKTDLLKLVVELQPKALVEKITSISPKALVRRGEFDLKYRIVQFGERVINDADSSGSSTAMVRQFVSDNEYTHDVVESNGSVPQTKRYRIEGPTSFAETTTSNAIFAEDDSRQIAVWIHATPTMTDQTATFVIEAAMGVRGSDADRDRTRLLGQAIFWQLRPRKVIIDPSIDRVAIKSLVDLSQSDGLRRLHQLIDLVRARAIVYQHQRESDSEGAVIASKDDFLAAQRMITALESSKRQVKLWREQSTLQIERVYEVFGLQDFGAEELARNFSVDSRTSNRWISVWMRTKIVECTTVSVGASPAKYRIAAAGLGQLGHGVAA